MFAMQNNFNQRPIPENISINFSISPDDPEVPVTPERISNYNDFDYEAELSSILQTPPNSSSLEQSNEKVRRTPGAEINDQSRKSQRSEEMDRQFQLLQAVQNLKLSTEPSSFDGTNSQAYFCHEPVQVPFHEQYSLWGHNPAVSNSNIGGPFDNGSQHVHSGNRNGPVRSHVYSFNQPQARYLAPVGPFEVPPPPPPNFNQPGPRNIPHFVSSASMDPNDMYYGSNGYSHNYAYYHPPIHMNSSHNGMNPHPNDTSHYQGVLSTNEPSKNKKTRDQAPHQVHRRQASSGSPRQTHTVSHKRSASTSSETVVVSQTLNTKEDNTSKQELADSPTSNTKFKQFYRGFKQKEKEGYETAAAFGLDHLKILPEKVHWRVYLELADLAKRENRISEARGYYEEVNRLQPTAAQGWLEYAKMEEECGNLTACKSILSAGLSHCTVNESLMVKCLKHYERMDHLEEARALLGALKDVPVERTWRTIMEGGLLEARQGNILVARQVFHYLIASVPWYGPIYQEACRFEEKCEEHENAMKFVESGLKENPRYGPLWFSALRLDEKLSENGDVTSMHETVERAVKSISKELIWKLYFEAAQIEERAGNIQEARDYYVKSVSYCPDNLLWKVWMGGARTELNYDNIDIARKLLKRALKEVPPKMKAMVLLECCRLEEYANQLDKAREILAKAKKYTKHEWKVFLESVLLEMRANNLDLAIEEAQQALTIHTGTGRLWAVMIQLKQSRGIEEQMKVFRTALSEVPKSGEVWCEGARIALQQKDFVAARKYINFAIQFTPQYGDSFIEYLRLEILEKGLDDANLQAVEQACVNADPNYGALWLHCKQNPLDSTRNVVREAVRLLTTPQSASDKVPAETALMVNNIYQNIHQRSNEERRKAIFL